MVQVAAARKRAEEGQEKLCSSLFEARQGLVGVEAAISLAGEEEANWERARQEVGKLDKGLAQVRRMVDFSPPRVW